MLASKVFQSLFLAVTAVIMLGASVEAAPSKASRCIQCFAYPTCPPCGVGYACLITPPSCYDCGKGECVKDDTTNCIKCFAPPMCPPCDPGFKCRITEATCHDCGKGECIRN